jgi:hypothetical protein
LKRKLEIGRSIRPADGGAADLVEVPHDDVELAVELVELGGVEDGLLLGFVGLSEDDREAFPQAGGFLDATVDGGRGGEHVPLGDQEVQQGAGGPPEIVIILGARGVELGGGVGIGAGEDAQATGDLLEPDPGFMDGEVALADAE